MADVWSVPAASRRPPAFLLRSSACRSLYDGDGGSGCLVGKFQSNRLARFTAGCREKKTRDAVIIRMVPVMRTGW